MSRLALLLSFLLIATACAALPPPAMLEPSATAIGISPHPHVAWTDVTGAERYRVQLANSPDFAAPLRADDTVHAVIRWFVFATPLPPATYHVRVRAERDDGTTGDWSAPAALVIAEPARTFHVTPATPLDEVRRLAREAAAGPSARIALAPGHYRWDPGYQQAVFAWTGASNILVDGEGADIALLDPSAQLFHLRDCRGITIRGLRTSHAPTPYSALEVLAVEPAGAWFEARVLDGFAEERYPREVNQFFVYAVATNDFMQKHPARPGHTYLAWDGTKRVASNAFRFHPRSAQEQGSLRQLRPGDRALACYRRWPLNSMSGCRDVAWSGIVGGTSEGALFMGGDNANIKFIGLRCARRGAYFPTAGGWVTGNDRRGPWIENCTWEGLTDDGPNITGNSFLIDAATNGTDFVVSTGPGYQTSTWRAGDEVVFWNPLDGRPLAETHVIETSRSGNRIAFRVTDPVPGLAPGRDLRTHTHVYNLSTQNRQLVIRGNRLVGGRRFGFNVKAVDALIDRNRFEGQASCAVYLENEPTGWEGLVCRNIVVQDNTIIGCGYDAHSRHLGRANIHVNLWRPGRGLEETDWRGHAGIVIRRNTLTDWNGIAIGVDNAKGVTIADNVIGRRGPLAGEAVRICDRTADRTLRPP
jgi:hypothetical protein